MIPSPSCSVVFPLLRCSVSLGGQHGGTCWWGPTSPPAHSPLQNQAPVSVLVQTGWSLASHWPPLQPDLCSASLDPTTGLFLTLRPHRAPTARLGQAQIRSQKLSLGPPGGDRHPHYLNHHLLPLSMFNSQCDRRHAPDATHPLSSFLDILLSQS